MAYFPQQLINGITLGAIYGLIAIGYTMVYGIIGMINFAHGDMFMVGAFIALIVFMLLRHAGHRPRCRWRWCWSCSIAMAFTALYGWTIERVAYRPLRGSFRLAPLISAIGMSIVAAELRADRQGARAKPLPPIDLGRHRPDQRASGFDGALSLHPDHHHRW